MSSHNNSDYYFLDGGGKMGELMREKDWSQTSLGNPEDWPLSLRILVPIMLENPIATYIAWGNDYTQLYNDSYRAILGTTKHPFALGNSTSETFPEIWDIVGPMFDGVMRGKAIGFPNFLLPLNRNGFLEECYFDFSYTPIRKENGEVGGILATVIETTKKKKVEEALIESEQRFRDTVHQAPVGITILRGREFVVEMANNTYLELIDREMSEFVGRPLFESLPEVKETVNALLEGVMNTGIPFQGNEVAVPLNRHGKQEVFYFDFLYHPLKENNGDISGIIVTVTEVTEKVLTRKKIEKSEEQYFNLIHSSPSAIAILEGEEIIISTANNAIKQMWGKGDDVIGKKYFELLPELEEQGFKEIIVKIYQTGIPFNANERPVYILQNGEKTLKYFNFTLYPQRTIDNEVNGIGLVGTDVTSEALLNNNVRQSEQRFQQLVSNATAAIVVLTGAEMKVEIVNDAYGRLINLTPDDLLGKPLFSLVPETAEYYLPILEKVRQSGEMLQLYDSPYAVTVNGKHIEGFLHCVFQPYRDINGNITGVMAILQDVTEAVTAHKKIEQSEKKFEAAILAVEGIIWTNDENGQMIGEQPGWAKLTGQSFEEYQGYGWTNAVHPEDIQTSVKSWNQAVADRCTYVFEHRVKTKEKGWRLFSIKAVPVFDETGVVQQWVGVHTDTTEQREAVEIIKESEGRFKAMADESPMIVFIVDPDPVAPVSYWNKTWYNYTGQTIEEAAGRAWDGIVHPDDVQVFMDIYTPAFAARQPYFAPAIRIKRFDGKYRWHSFKSNPRHLPNGEFNGYIGVGFDIHEQKVAQEEIKESEKRFRLLADSLPQHIWTSNPEGNLNYYNQSVFDYSGLTLEQINKDGWIQIVHPDDRDENTKQWINAIKNGQNFLLEHRFRKHDGQYRWQISRAVPQKDENGKIQMWVGTSTDIHEQKVFVDELERQVNNRTKELAQSNLELEKMNKELDSFVYISSHDLQEPLRKIQTFASYLLEKEVNNLSETGKDYFDRINKSAQRLQILIQDLLAYSRTKYTERKFESTDLCEIIDDVKDDLKEEINQMNATIEANLLGNADIIPFQFRQLMYNLIANSLKFSKPGITPLIQIKSKVANGLALNESKLLPHVKYCHITVSDNGIGFKQEYSEKIFQLFQRLHGRNEFYGTGIGLSIVKKIVENHDGIIIASGNLDKGATFDIYFPTS